MLLPEIVTVGIYNSSIVSKNSISKNRKTSMFEIELPLENGGTSYINDDSAPINTNMIICAKPGQIRHTKFPFKCYYVHIIINDSTLYDTLMNTPNFFETNKRDYYEKIFSELLLYYNTGIKKDEIKLQSLILELIYSISKDSVKILKRDSIKNNNYLLIEKILDYIKNNLTEDLSLEKISQTVSMSPIYFHNSFKTAVGTTLREYVEEQRIKKAINLLATTELTLTQIAYDCGFSSQSYFSYAFKRKMKTTPRKYIQSLNKLYEK